MNTPQKLAARKLVAQWTFRRRSEKGKDQQFWKRHIQYQVPVPVAARSVSAPYQRDDGITWCFGLFQPTRGEIR